MIRMMKKNSDKKEVSVYTVYMDWNGGETTFSAKNTESDFFQRVAEELVKIPYPNDAYIEVSGVGCAQFDLKERSGSLCINEVMNTLKFKECGDYKETYLTCIDAGRNNYKYYRLTPQVDGTVLASYGRIACDGLKNGQRTFCYPGRMYWIKKLEKLSKGYVDQSEYCLTEVCAKSGQALITDTDTSDSIENVPGALNELFQKLTGAAKVMVHLSLACDLSIGMITRSRELLNSLYVSKDLEEFNAILSELLVVAPRKVSSVKFLMAKKPEDFSQILDREETLISAMETLLPESMIHITEKAKKKAKKYQGLNIFHATEVQKALVMKHLPENLRRKVLTIYRVKNHTHEENFAHYLKKNHIDNVKLFWHGSRTENWFSIINKGLLLNPNAIITGKMFGNGIYFAHSAMKSWGYTSGRGAKWTNGTSNNSFMGLYATAYGTPLVCNSAHHYTKEEVTSHHANCVHAKAGSQLLADEVIFYDEAAMCLQYIVEFGA